MINVHGLRRNMKNVVKNYSDAQIKVREATSNDPWGPSGTLMSEIADLTYNVVAFSEIMQVVWKRLNDHGKNWKHVYKALVLLEYLIKTGSEKVTQQCKENIFAIQTLKDFQYFEDNKDQGVNVREKAKQLVSLLKDDERLKNERTRALKARERFAQATSLVKPEPVTRQYGSVDFSQGSFDEDMLSPSALSLSELEHARPQTAGEEELQLQLALAMSKEEADQSERLKRNDDLRLQMALSESEEEFKKVRVEEKKKPLSAVEDLLGLSITEKEGGQSRTQRADPWGMSTALAQSTSVTNNLWNIPDPLNGENQNAVRNDPWSSPIFECNNINDAAPFSNEQKYSTLGMRKSMSVDVDAQRSSPIVANPVEAFLGAESSLVNFDSSLRSRTLGNPFQAARPAPVTINELRAQNGHPNFDMSATLPLPPSQNPHPNSGYTTQHNSQNPFI